MKVRIPFLVTLLFIYSVTIFSQTTKVESVRQVTKLNDDWLFVKNNIENIDKVDFNVASKIHLPHNWGVEEAQKGDKNFNVGIGWYKRIVTISPIKGKRYFLRFEGVSVIGNIYINGKYIGEHRGAFGAFCYDITTALSGKGEDVLIVKVDNNKPSDVAPLGGDFNVYGGIYRSVSVIETSEINFILTDHASKGVSWIQTSVSNKKAIINVNAIISNPTKEGLPFNHHPKAIDSVIPYGLYTLEAKIIDAEGKLIESTKKDINIIQSSNAPFNLQIEVSKPHLWHGTLDPYLYTAVVELKSKEGEIIDNVIQKIGLRSFKIDPDKGAFLNGKPYRLKGVSKHQDRANKGWAVSDEDLEEDIQLILEMGANALRCAHYQHSDYLLDLCDTYGVLVWAELPLVGSIKNEEDFIKTNQNQFKDLIRQNINRPSIFAWSMFNEVHLSNADPHRIFMDLQNLAKGEDPSRYTIAATSHMHSPSMNKITDILGWNRYPGWYDPIEDLISDTHWDKYKYTSKNGGFCFSEYGAGANINHHEQNPEQPVPNGFWHPEEWQSLMHETAWARFEQTPYIWGSFVWNMFDFYAVRRKEGGQIGINDKGLITSDRKIKKDAFYFYKANWSTEPMIHLTSKRHSIRDKEITPIKVYTNGLKVEVKLNGKIASIKPNKVHVAVLNNVKLKKGENTIEVSTKIKGKIFNDTATWIYDPTFKSLKYQSDNNGKIIKGDGGFGH